MYYKPVKKNSISFIYMTESDLIEILSRLNSTLDKIAGKNILITGAAGFLGRYFIALFQLYNSSSENPIKIVALDNHITSSRLEKNDHRLSDPNIEWIYGDAELGARLPDIFEYIVHAAGIASPVHYQANPLGTIDVTINATRALLEKSKTDKSRMLYFSSSEIYGDPVAGSVPTDETYRGNVSPRGPRACYDESKRLGETLCWVYENYFGVHVSVARPFNIYGPGMLPNDYRVLPNFVSSLILGKSIKVYGSGEQTRTFCYITDAIVAFLTILVEGKRPDVYNVGNPAPEITMSQLATQVKEISKLNSPIEVIDYPSQYPTDDPNRRCPNIDKLYNEFKFIPEIDLKLGISRFYKWAFENYPKLNP
jgi:UDP-glucuronate decarboxylase